ncbi:MAG TPA: DUF5996 family protein [Ktedonobacterales bacterium]
MDASNDRLGDANAAPTGSTTPPVEAHDALWPSLPLAAWQDTYATLHMWTQIVGKVPLALCPPVNHWWAVALQVTPLGLATVSIPYGTDAFQITFDFFNQTLWVRTGSGRGRAMALYPRPVADFYRELMAMLRSLDINVTINTLPQEVSNPIPCDEDFEHAAYDAEAVMRWWRITQQSSRVLQGFRGRFAGKSSPVHFFWGSFDLALTRFSGRRAPPRPEADRITREAYSHEEWSCGFWPGSVDGGVREPAYYAYASPEPAGFAEARIVPASAAYHRDLSEYILPYEAVRTAVDPDQALHAFAQSTYDAAATLASWDRAALEHDPPQPAG